MAIVSFDISPADVSALSSIFSLADIGACYEDGALVVKEEHGETLENLIADLPEARKKQLKALAAAARWQKENGGITVSGVPVATDDRSKQMIMGARIASEADSGFTTPWVGSDGSIHTLNAAQVVAISNAVLAHVAGCFATFAMLLSDIDANAVTTREEIDAAFAE